MELGLYLHLPFCKAKCFYCDFNSYPIKEEKEVLPYVSSLYREIDLYAKKFKNATLKTIYWGGGTPTILSGNWISNIINFLKDNFNTAPNMEITVEANPGTIDKEKLDLLLKAGVNRLSLGAQSFNDYFLKRLGRIHTVPDIISSYLQARESGFDNINLDIMFALPDQTLSDFQSSVKKAVALKPDHLSLYNLTLEEGTEFFKSWEEGRLNLPDEEVECAMYSWAIDFLKKNGFEHYEISNFARPSKRSLHNQIYWHNQPYLGIGAGASSFIKGYRYMNFKDPQRYIQEVERGKFPIEEGEKLPRRKRMGETIILGLRTKEGVSYQEFKDRFKIGMDKIFSSQIAQLVDSGLLKRDEDKIQLTPRGLFLANYVFQEFVDG